MLSRKVKRLKSRLFRYDLGQLLKGESTLQAQAQRPDRARGAKNKGALGRAIGYLSKYKAQAALPYVFLVIAVLSQLMVPKLVGNIIDAISGGVIAQNVVPNLDKVPKQFLPVLFEQLGYTPEQLANLYANADRRCV